MKTLLIPDNLFTTKELAAINDTTYQVARFFIVKHLQAGVMLIRYEPTKTRIYTDWNYIFRDEDLKNSILDCTNTVDILNKDNIDKFKQKLLVKSYIFSPVTVTGYGYKPWQIWQACYGIDDITFPDMYTKNNWLSNEEAALLGIKYMLDYENQRNKNTEENISY